MTKQAVFLMFLCLSFVQLGSLRKALASDEYSSYDDIVRDLKNSEIATTAPTRPESPFDSIRIHVGTGLVNSHLNMKTPARMPSSASLNGYEVFMGIDLFSRDWIAEGSARSFNPDKFAGTNVSLREFDIKFIHKDFVGRTLFWRGGVGMAARYITFDQKPNGLSSDNYTTPASIFLLGLGAQFNSNLSLGADLNYRTALITDTIEKSAVDGNLRVTGTF